MASQLEVILNFESIPLFNVFKYFVASLLFGSILDKAATTMDSAFARRELLSRGWAGFPKLGLPRINRSGLEIKFSTRTGFALLTLSLALISDVFDELSYDAKEVSVNDLNTDATYIMIANGTVTSPGLYSAVGQASYVQGVECFGRVRDGYYADHAIIVEDDGNVDIQSSQSGIRDHFSAKCGRELQDRGQAFPVAVIRETHRVDRWLEEAGSKPIRDTSLPFDVQMSGPTHLEYAQRITDEGEYDFRITTFETHAFYAVFPSSKWFCVASIFARANKTLPDFGLCWHHQHEVVHLRLVHGITNASFEEFENLGSLNTNITAVGGEALVRGITTLPGFLSWCITFLSYASPYYTSPIHSVLAARLTVLNMQYSAEFAGKEVTAERAIRPVIRLIFFLPSLVIVISSGLVAAFLFLTKRTTPLTLPEGLARYLCCPGNLDEKDSGRRRTQQTYIIVREREGVENPSYYVSVSQDIREADRPKKGLPVHGLYGCLRKRGWYNGFWRSSNEETPHT